MITINADWIEAGDETARPRVFIEAVKEAVIRHESYRRKYKRLYAYYLGQHKIAGRQRAKALPNTRLAHGFPAYIVNMAAGYLVGNPITYQANGQEAALLEVLDQMREANVDSVDSELATHASIYGLGVEILYANEYAQPRMAAASPMDTFVVYDDTVEHRPLFAVRRFAGGTEVFTDSYRFRFAGGRLGLDRVIGQEPHFFGGVPVVEYWNNAEERGDFEGVMDLIDAYNAVQSDRVNDKQQFTDAILITRGISEIAANPGDERTAAQRINDEKLLMFPDKEADASFLTKQLSQGDTEILKDALKADIHKFAMVPDLTDEQFSGNSSGVAMKFKLLGLEQMTKIKERWFREALKTRLKLIAHFMEIRGAMPLNAAKVRITFTHALPKNELETAQMIGQLKGLVPEEVLLSQLSFYDGNEN